MVKFGGHVEALREGDNRGTDLYLVDYIGIKDIIFQDGDMTSKFVDTWDEALKASEDDFRSARKSLWDDIFGAIAERDPEGLRGAHPGNALQIYVDNMHPDKVHEMLIRMEQLLRATSTNTESLRKLVKKHDKYRRESLSLSLLPVLYTSSLYASQNMLQDGIVLLRGLLDDAEMASVNPMVRQNSEDRHRAAVTVRMDEFDWLRRLVASIPQDDLLPRLVAHRGFHHIQDRNDKRPLENSLSAYEVAWTSGIRLCECDIAMTKDEKLVLAHDENFLRLALDHNDENSHRHVSDLTFRELISMPLKNGVRPPLLIDVLRSACAISDHSQLIIEIKPGNEAAASALARLLIRHPDLRQAVAMIMSFDAVTMHRLRAELTVVEEADLGLPITASQGGMHHRVTSFDHFGTMVFSSHRRISSMDKLAVSTSLSQNQFESTKILEQEPIVEPMKPQHHATSTMPKLMLLTVAAEPKRLCEQRVSINDVSPIDSWLTMADGSLDGVYMQFEKKMMTEEGASALRKLSERHLVGIWSYSGVDPDDYPTFEWLVRQGNCTFVNSDLPNHFRKEIFVRQSSGNTNRS